MAESLSAGSEESQRTWSQVAPESAKNQEPLAPLMEEENANTAPTILPPAASESALIFLSSINTKQGPKILIEDDISSITKEGTQIGSFKVKVDVVFRITEEVYLVHASSVAEIDKIPCGTTVTAYISKQLVTLEQQHTEFIKIDAHSVERKTLTRQQPDGSYTVRRTIRKGEDNAKEHNHTYKAEEMAGFISEGANLILQRLFVLNKPEEAISAMKFLAFDSDCNVCPSEYLELADRDIEINGEVVTVTGIERRVWPLHPSERPPPPPSAHPDVPLAVLQAAGLAPSDEDAIKHEPMPDTWQSFYLASGHLATRLQVGSPISMAMQKLPVKPVYEDLIPKPVIEKKPLNYEDDLELLSTFNQKKSEYSASHETYLDTHPGLRSLLADFLQHVMLRKPDDVIGAARDFFGGYSNADQGVQRAYSHAADFRPDLSQIKEHVP